MILNRVVAQNNLAVASQVSSRALNLLMDEMAVWYPAPYYDIEAMVSEETKGFKSNCRPKAYESDLSAKRGKNKKYLVASNSASVCAL